jgi:iron(III) transport system substrate-binding protein
LSRKIVVAAVLLALVSAGCGSSRDALTIYSGRTLNLVGPLAANKPRTSANHNAVVEAVSRGEFQMGLVDHHLQPPLPAGEPRHPSRNHSFAGDDVGALVIPSTASVLGDTDRAEEASRVVDLLLSAEAQRYFGDQTFEHPLAAGIPVAAGLPPLATLRSPDYDMDALGGGRERTVELIRSSGFDGV